MPTDIFHSLRSFSCLGKFLTEWFSPKKTVFVSTGAEGHRLRSEATVCCRVGDCQAFQTAGPSRWWKLIPHFAFYCLRSGYQTPTCMSKPMCFALFKGLAIKPLVSFRISSSSPTQHASSHYEAETVQTIQRGHYIHIMFMMGHETPLSLA